MNAMLVVEAHLRTCRLAALLGKRLLAVIIGLGIPLLCWAEAGSNPAVLEKELLEALQVNDKGDDRLGNSEKVIQDYGAGQWIERRRTERIDFEDYYVLRKPALFLGHDLLVIRGGHGREVEDGATGCCVDYGLTVYVRVKGDEANLAQFAEVNRCRYETDEDVEGVWKEVVDTWAKERPPQSHPPISLPKGRYASVECTDLTLQEE